jgi:hypothetical protein
MAIAPRRAIYGKLAGDVTLNALLATPPAGRSKSIYYQRAPQGAPFPYVILSKQAGTPRYALGDRAYDNDVWLVKGVDRNDTADTVDAISSRIDALLTDASLSISGRTQLYLRRESDVDYPETVDDSTYLHSGATYRLIYQ